jgi:sugar-specific transcriptional regulator TrmB
MSYERIVKTLTNLGLAKRDVEVYIHLATNGPQRAENIAETLKIQEVHLLQTLQNLQNKGIINCVLEPIPFYFALPFDKALDLLVEARLRTTIRIEQEKERILSGRRLMFPDHSKN